MFGACFRFSTDKPGRKIALTAETLKAANDRRQLRNWRSVLAVLVGAQSPFETKRALWGYAFLSPWLLGLLIFVSGPMVACFILSFTEYDILSNPKWVGFQNYYVAFFEDDLFWPSMSRTFYYAIITIAPNMIGSLLLAMLLNQGLRGTNVFRSVFFLPHLTPVVAMAALWVWLMNPRIGPLNYVLSYLGWPHDFPWLTSSTTVIPSLALMGLWSGLGGNTMLIFLASLQGVPQELYEVASIDGASSWKKLWYVTLPMISPAMFFNLVLGVIQALQVFTRAWVATSGGPYYSSWFISIHIYQQSFQYFRMGYGSALAWIFAAVVLFLTIVNLKISDKWVYYGGAI